VGETSANNKKSPEDQICLLDLKPGGKRYEITTRAAKRTASYFRSRDTQQFCRDKQRRADKSCLTISLR